MVGETVKPRVVCGASTSRRGGDVKLGLVASLVGESLMNGMMRTLLGNSNDIKYQLPLSHASLPPVVNQ